MSQENQQKVLTIAGFDPCAGAGLLADVKTFERYNVYAMAVNTVNTIQTENRFLSVDWLSLEHILNQTEVLLKTYQPKFVKIGLVKNFTHLWQIVEKLSLNGVDFIVWDPILKSSTGYDFHQKLADKDLEKALDLITLTTPNLEEHKILKPFLEGKDYVLKGGHATTKWVDDVLHWKGSKIHFSRPRLAADKHGTGCVFSAALLAGLAKDLTIEVAVKKAGEYIHKALQTSSDLLIDHFSIANPVKEAHVTT